MTSSSIRTNPNYWDCECGGDAGMHIHPKNSPTCFGCMTTSDEQPDGRQDDIDDLITAYFHIVLHSRNGEYEYYHHQFIEAVNQTHAKLMAEEAASTFYDNPDDEEVGEEILEGHYAFWCGEVVVSVSRILELSYQDYTVLSHHINNTYKGG